MPNIVLSSYSPARTRASREIALAVQEPESDSSTHFHGFKVHTPPFCMSLMIHNMQSCKPYSVHTVKLIVGPARTRLVRGRTRP